MLCAQHGNAPGWSFATGLGQNQYPFSFEPISELLFSLGTTSVPTVMLAMNLAYVYLAGVAMFLLLGELKLHSYARMLGGLAYAFSGYSILSSSWVLPNFAPQAFQFALLLWALERGLARRQYFWLLLPVSLIAINYPVNVYFAGLISAGYLIARTYLHKEGIAAVWPKIIRLLPAALLGLGLSAFILLGTVYGMRLSPRGAGAVRIFSEPVPLIEDAGALWSSALRLFSPNLLGDAAHFRAYRNYIEAPLHYCGILTVLVAAAGLPLFNKRGRIISIAALSIIVLVFCFPPLRNLVWLHLGNYYRILNLFAALAFVLISSHALSQLFTTGAFARRPLLIAAAACVLVLLLGAQQHSESAATSYLPIAIIIAYTVVLLAQQKLKPRNFFIVLACLLCADLALAADELVQGRGICDRTDMAQKGYNDASSRLIAALQKRDSSFYRIEKDFYSTAALVYSYNEALVQQYRASSTYGPFNSVHYIRFLSLFGVIPPGDEQASRFVVGLRHNPALMKLCATKYFISTKPLTDTMRYYGFRPIQEAAAFTLWKDTSPLPFGFCYGQAVNVEQFEKMSNPVKSEVAFAAIAMSAKELAGCEGISTYIPDTIRSGILDDAVQSLKRDTLAIQSFSDQHFTGKVALQQSKLLFLSMPFDEGWAVKDNGRAVRLRCAFGGLCAVYLPHGSHALDFCYSAPYKRTGTLISLCSLAIIGMIGGWQIFSKRRRSLRRTNQ